MKSNNFFLCVLMMLLGVSTICNTELFKPTSAKANDTEVSLPTYNFTPIGKFNLDLNLASGTASVESNLKIAEAKVNVTHPTKYIEVEKVKYLPSEEIRDTITYVSERLLMFPLAGAKINAPKPTIPNKVEYDK